MKLIQLFFAITLLFDFSCSGTGGDAGQAGTTPVSSVQEKKGEELPADSANALLSTIDAEEGILEASNNKIEGFSSQTKSNEKKQSPVEPKLVEKKEKKAKGLAIIEFKETSYDFGVIKQGDKIQHDFVFENTGKSDLEILKVDATCGCTTPTFPFIPIAPGEKGTIGVTYDSTGKLGNQKPIITIVSNAKPHTVKIYLKGVVDAERVQDKKEATDSKENN